MLATALALSSGLASLVLTGCPGPDTPAGGNISEQGSRWLERAKQSYKAADLEDASDSAKSALTNAPDNADVKITAARIQLARLEFAETIRLLQGLQTSESFALRGRAKWYSGDVEGAADDLDALLADPQTKDEWAKTIARLAHQGSGRKPFQVSGGLLAPVPLQRIRSAHLIVPIEINGEAGLALVATSRAEVMLDSATRKEPSWVQLRFENRIEVRDVPALVEDLSGISKEVGAPIKALLGANLLRRLHVTFDFQGEQFVVRTREPPPPPKATRLPVAYAQGGAMVTRASFKAGSNETLPLLINTMLPYPLALDERGFKAAGVDMNTLQAVPGDNRMKGGKVSLFRLGAFDLPDVPAVSGPSFTEIAAATGMDVSGAVGAGLFALFRCTLTDNGRVLWVEDNDQVMQMLQQAPPPAPAGSGEPGGMLAPPGGLVAPGGATPGLGLPPAGSATPAPAPIGSARRP